MRVRDIIHRDGRRLRLALTIDPHGEGPVFRLGDPAHADGRIILLDLYGGELLAGFLMSARLARVGELPDERCNGDCPLHLRLSAVGGEPRIKLDQLGNRLVIARPLWDRLYAELQLALAHGRHLERTRPATALVMGEAPRLLH